MVARVGSFCVALLKQGAILFYMYYISQHNSNNVVINRVDNGQYWMSISAFEHAKAYMPNGTTLVVESRTGHIVLWDLKKGQIIRG